MPLKPAPIPLRFTATQGSADAFVQTSVTTGITGRQAYNIKEVQWGYIAPAAISGIAADFEISVALTRRSKTAMPDITDVDVIWKGGVIVGLVTSGIFRLDPVNVYNPDLELPIIEETLYVQLDSTGTGLANVIFVKLLVEQDTMSDIDRLNLANRSL